MTALTVADITAFYAHEGTEDDPEWGGFGYLLTRQGKMDMYISRTDPLVVVRLRGGRPLLITPERPSLFVEQVSALAR